MKTTQPDLSIIIVSFNAWEFLDLTLFSVQKAMQGLSCEVILVDNASDGVVNQVSESYPFVRIIANNKNLGFAKANNIGLKAATGRFAVLLNPDVIVGEDTFETILECYKEHPSIGGMGLRMLNGKGDFLKESKRGLPTPLTSFYKIIGLCKLYPSSERFAKYYHGNLNEKQNHEVEILSGAFLVQPRDADGNFELLDERYFMYGEDIDLSWQLKQKFGRNYYLGDHAVIHFKGQSTPSSAAISRYFYQAMWMFHVKYFKDRTSSLVNALIWLAVHFIQVLKTGLLFFKRTEVKSSNVSPSIVQIITSNTNMVSRLETLYPGSEVEIVQVPEKDNRSAHLVVFDLATVANREVIQLLEKLGTGHYAYLSSCGRYLIENANGRNKGTVIRLEK